MASPRAESIFTAKGRLVGIQLGCPDCPELLRVETPLDYPFGECPEIVGQAGALGLIASCGCRVEMKSHRLARTQMLREPAGGD